MRRCSAAHGEAAEVSCPHGGESAVFPVPRTASGVSHHPADVRILFRLGQGVASFFALHPAGMYAGKGSEDPGQKTFFAAIAALAAKLGVLSFAAMCDSAAALGV